MAIGLLADLQGDHGAPLPCAPFMAVGEFGKNTPGVETMTLNSTSRTEFVQHEIPFKSTACIHMKICICNKVFEWFRALGSLACRTNFIFQFPTGTDVQWHCCDHAACRAHAHCSPMDSYFGQSHWPGWFRAAGDYLLPHISSSSFGPSTHLQPALWVWKAANTTVSTIEMVAKAFVNPRIQSGNQGYPQVWVGGWIF